MALRGRRLPKLSHIDLSDNQLSNEGAKALVALVETTPTIVSISLEGNSSVNAASRNAVRAAAETNDARSKMMQVRTKLPSRVKKCVPRLSRARVRCAGSGEDLPQHERPGLPPPDDARASALRGRRLYVLLNIHVGKRPQCPEPAFADSTPSHLEARVDRAPPCARSAAWSSGEPPQRFHHGA